MVHFDRARLGFRQRAPAGVAVTLGIGLLVLAWMTDKQWLIVHFPPDYFPPYRWIENGVHAVRIVLAMVGISLVFLFPRQIGLVLGRSTTGKWLLPTAGTIMAVFLALVVAELILQSSGWQSVNSGEMKREPLRLHDRVLGWTLQPSHTGYLVTGGRRIEYANDIFGYREPSQETKPDFARPTIVLAGESVMGGFGLNWDETIAAQVSRLMNVQTVDLSVGGYATDQIYLRLNRELRRFDRPVAVVILFSPMLFRRNMDDFRPHLGPDLVLRPPLDRSKLMDMARWAIPYRSADETDRAILTTRAILTSTARLAKSRGAIPIVLVPQFVPENPVERLIRSRVLGHIDLPVLSVPLDSSWRLPGDWHPNARAARVMAFAISSRLRSLAPNKPDLAASTSRGGKDNLISSSE